MQLHLVYVMVCISTLIYMLLASHDSTSIVLPGPADGSFFFAPNETQALLLEGARIDAAMQIEAATRVKELAAAEHTTATTTTTAARRTNDDGVVAVAVAATSTQSELQPADRILLKYGVAVMADATGRSAPRIDDHQRRRVEAIIEHVHEMMQHYVNGTTRDVDVAPPKIQVMMAADSGGFSGMHELTYLYAAMRFKTNVHVPRCASAVLGFAEKRQRDPLTRMLHPTSSRMIPVLAITSGIYVTRAAACTSSVMAAAAAGVFDVQSVVWMGTAGVSPVVGGGGWSPTTPTPSSSSSSSVGGKADDVVSAELDEMRTNPACQHAWPTTSTKVAIGSVCVTYAALLQECGICVEETPSPTLCSRPRCRMHNDTNFFGRCGFSHPNRLLAERMKGAMQHRPLPPMPDEVAYFMDEFWMANEATPAYERVERPDVVSDEASSSSSSSSTHYFARHRQAPTSPMLLHCAEVATSQILAGVRSDVLCREYSHDLLAGTYEREELTCVQAMEGVGMMHVMAQHAHIPVAIVRGASNYDMYPLKRVPHQRKRDDDDGDGQLLRTRAAMEAARNISTKEDPANQQPMQAGSMAEVLAKVGSSGNVHGIHHSSPSSIFVAWEQKEDFMSEDEFRAMTAASYRYAVETSTAVVLNYLLSADTVLPGDETWEIHA